MCTGRATEDSGGQTPSVTSGPWTTPAESTMLRSPIIQTSSSEPSLFSQLCVPLTPLPGAEVGQSSSPGGDERQGGEEYGRLCSKQVGLNTPKYRVSANLYSRQSLQLTPSSTPVRPPRRKRPESASYDGYSVASSQVMK